MVYNLGNNGAHISPALSLADILAVLFNEITDVKRCDFKKNIRDRFILSKGHGAPAYYAVLYEKKIITEDEFDTFDKNGGNYPGQPSKNLDAGIDYSGGSLGLGLSYACGLSLSQKGENNHIYVLLGDGECNEGTVWESAMFAGFHKLNNITAIVDYNRMQSDGFSADILEFDLKAMFKACNWELIECDGHNTVELKKAFEVKSEKPKVIIARTIKGKGVSFMENKQEWHHNRITKEQYDVAMKELA